MALSLVLALTPLVVHGLWARTHAQESGAPGYPARLHEGTCSSLGKVVYPLANVTRGGSPAGVVGTPQAVGVPSGIPMEASVTTVAVSLDALLAAPHNITIAESADPTAVLIACGDVGGLRTGDDLVLGLMSMSGSGQTGSAWLHGSNAETTVTIFSARGLFDPAAPLNTATMPPQPTTAATTPPSTAASPRAATAAGTVQTVDVQMVDFKFIPSTITIPANTPVKFVFRNTGLALHNFSIDALKTSTDVPSGTTAETTITAPAGTYQFYCDQPGHKEMGMVGTLTVT